MISDDLVDLVQGEIDKIMLSKHLSVEEQERFMNKLSDQIDYAHRECAVRLKFTGLNG
jgi:hypothetical protein